MKYVLLVYGEEQKLHDLTKEEMAKVDRDSLAHDRSLEKAGQLIVAQALQSVKTSKSVRRRSGVKEISDGPFAETKEQLLGFLMVEAEELDEALEIAGDVPLAKMGTVEVRAIYNVPDPNVT